MELYYNNNKLVHVETETYSDENNDLVEEDLTLEVFDSQKIKIKEVPKLASQTCKGQVLIKPIV